MTERKQLELAAKACGIDGEVIEEHRMIREFCFIKLIYLRKCGAEWNPSTNQLDSDRMGAKLRIDVAWDKDGVAAFHERGAAFYEWFKDHNDENAALMAARMRCAAALQGI